MTHTLRKGSQHVGDGAVQRLAIVRVVVADLCERPALRDGGDKVPRDRDAPCVALAHRLRPLLVGIGVLPAGGATAAPAFSAC